MMGGFKGLFKVNRAEGVSVIDEQLVTLSFQDEQVERQMDFIDLSVDDLQVMGAFHLLQDGIVQFVLKEVAD